LLAAFVALGVAACGREVYLGSLGAGGNDGGGDGGNAGILWQATFEPGDLSEWQGDGKGGVYMDLPSQAPSVSSAVVHRGQFSGVANFTPTGGMPYSYLYRDQPSPREAYYGAWFYIPANLQIGSWLSLLHFGYRPTAGAATSPVWDFNVHPGADGRLIARLYESASVENTEQASPIPVPMATWIHFEILFRKAADATGHITVWQDGVEILDVANAITAPTDLVQWDCGGGGNNEVTPSPGMVYFDDATISTTRVGTGQ